MRLFHFATFLFLQLFQLCKTESQAGKVRTEKWHWKRPGTGKLQLFHRLFQFASCKVEYQTGNVAIGKLRLFWSCYFSMWLFHATFPIFQSCDLSTQCKLVQDWRSRRWKTHRLRECVLQLNSPCLLKLAAAHWFRTVQIINSHSLRVVKSIIAACALWNRFSHVTHGINLGCWESSRKLWEFWPELRELILRCGLWWFRSHNWSILAACTQGTRPENSSRSGELISNALRTRTDFALRPREFLSACTSCKNCSMISILAYCAACAGCESFSPLFLFVFFIFFDPSRYGQDRQIGNWEHVGSRTALSYGPCLMGAWRERKRENTVEKKRGKESTLHELIPSAWALWYQFSHVTMCTCNLSARPAIIDVVVRRFARIGFATRRLRELILQLAGWRIGFKPAQIIISRSLRIVKSILAACASRNQFSQAGLHQFTQKAHYDINFHRPAHREIFCSWT